MVFNTQKNLVVAYEEKEAHVKDIETESIRHNHDLLRTSFPSELKKKSYCLLLIYLWGMRTQREIEIQMFNS